MRNPGKFQSFLRGFLLAWVLLAQAGAFAHELSHEGIGDQEVCATCSAGTVLQAASCSSSEGFLPAKRLEALPVLPATPLTRVSLVPQQARAPPASS
jgi:hypothetical protein